MDEVFQFLTLIITIHLIIGCSIVAVIRLLLSSLSLNATTRHNIWLSLLVLLVFMPLAIFLPTPATTEASLNAQSPEASTRFDSTAKEALLSSGLTQPDAQEKQNQGSISLLTGLVLESLTASNKLIVEKLSAGKIGPVPLYRLGYLLMLLIAIGVMLKLRVFIRSYLILRNLYATSETASEECMALVRRLAIQIGVCNFPMVKVSGEVHTPSSSGVFRPWIVLPTALLDGQDPEKSLEQILLHELAHIKRRDPLVASLQALVSIFMFWHPAIHYANRQVRFERELACDDWVIKSTARDATAQVKSYANSLLSIAESLQRKVPIDHSVACVHTSHGLINRINILLDNSTDHSTSLKRIHSGWLTILAMAILIASLPLWPKLPEFITEQNVVSQISAPTKPTVTAEVAQPQIAQTRVENSYPSELTDASTLAEPAANNRAATQVTASEPAAARIMREDPADIGAVENQQASNGIAGTGIPVETNASETTLDVEDTPEISAILARRDQPESPRPLNKLVDMRVNPEPVPVPVTIAAQSFSVEPAIVAIQPEAERAEIISAENLSRSQLEAEIRKIEDEYFRVFNAHIEDDRLKIQCGDYTPTGSYIKKRFCEPRFVIDARSESTQRAMEHNVTPPSPRSTGLLLARKSDFEDLTTAMNLTLRESNYFRELNGTLKRLKSRLQDTS